jgi:hypothetical protein
MFPMSCSASALQRLLVVLLLTGVVMVMALLVMALQPLMLAASWVLQPAAAAERPCCWRQAAAQHAGQDEPAARVA